MRLKKKKKKKNFKFLLGCQECFLRLSCPKTLENPRVYEVEFHLQIQGILNNQTNMTSMLKLKRKRKKEKYEPEKCLKDRKEGRGFQGKLA
jgi:hypothetical protein